MHKVLDATSQLLLSLPQDESAILVQLLRVARDLPGAAPQIAGMLEALEAELPESRRGQEVVQAWADQGIAMVRVITAFGDPVELSEQQARALVKQIGNTIDD